MAYRAAPQFDLGKALKSALGGGLSGAAGEQPLAFSLHRGHR